MGSASAKRVLVWVAKSWPTSVSVITQSARTVVAILTVITCRWSCVAFFDLCLLCCRHGELDARCWLRLCAATFMPSWRKCALRHHGGWCNRWTRMLGTWTTSVRTVFVDLRKNFWCNKSQSLIWQISKYVRHTSSMTWSMLSYYRFNHCTF